MKRSALSPFVLAGAALTLNSGAQAQTSPALRATMIFGQAKPEVTPEVTPIAWRQFRLKPRSRPRSDLQQSRQLLQNAVRYNLGWMKATYSEATYSGAPSAMPLPATPARPASEESVIRPPASAVLAVATALQCGAYDAKVIGVARNEATSRTVALINALAAAHLSNLPATGAAPDSPLRRWGSTWQSALWTAFIGQAGWMLWDELDARARGRLANLVSAEADRFIAPQYQVPYWKTDAGKENFIGDTKAEENAWNAMVIQVACAMMPGHSHAAAWRRVGSELMISAFANQQDALSNGQIIDGQSVKSWLRGFNLRSFLVQSLAGQPVSQSASFNAPLVYATLVDHQWVSPPFLAPGGTLYQPGQVELYYPQKTDWSRTRFDIYYLMDLNADAFELDKELRRKARAWIPLRAQRLLSMQSRHSDGHLYAPGEFDTYKGREQLAAWQFADAYLLLWLKSQGKLSQSANWLAQTPAQVAPQ